MQFRNFTEIFMNAGLKFHLENGMKKRKEIQCTA